MNEEITPGFSGQNETVIQEGGTQKLDTLPSVEANKRCEFFIDEKTV